MQKDGMEILLDAMSGKAGASDPPSEAELAAVRQRGGGFSNYLAHDQELVWELAFRRFAHTGDLARAIAEAAEQVLIVRRELGGDGIKAELQLVPEWNSLTCQIKGALQGNLTIEVDDLDLLEKMRG